MDKISMWMSRYQFAGYDLYHLVAGFFLFSIIGWMVESVYMSLCNRKLTNRGFMSGPFCPIYGVGATLGYILLHPFADNIFALYIVGALLATAFEYLVARLMMKLFGEVWWDYTHKKFNYKGILCLESTLGWGIVAVFVFGYLDNAISRMVMSWNKNLTMLLGIVLCVSYFIDFSYHFVHSYHRNKYDANVEELDESEYDEEDEIRTIKKA